MLADRERVRADRLAALDGSDVPAEKRERDVIEWEFRHAVCSDIEGVLWGTGLFGRRDMCSVSDISRRRRVAGLIVDYIIGK